MSSDISRNIVGTNEEHLIPQGRLSRFNGGLVHSNRGPDGATRILPEFFQMFFNATYVFNLQGLKCAHHLYRANFKNVSTSAL